MNGHQIERIFLSNPFTRLIYNGVYRNNSLPFDLLQKETSLTVININRKKLSVKHWVIPYKIGQILYFFDSLAKCPKYYGGGIMFFYQTFSGCVVTALKKPLQPLNSYTCGAL